MSARIVGAPMRRVARARVGPSERGGASSAGGAAGGFVGVRTVVGRPNRAMCPASSFIAFVARAASTSLNVMTSESATPGCTYSSRSTILSRAHAARASPSMVILHASSSRLEWLSPWLAMSVERKRPLLDERGRVCFSEWRGVLVPDSDDCRRVMTRTPGCPAAPRADMRPRFGRAPPRRWRAGSRSRAPRHRPARVWRTPRV